jgi:hypothetical protein
VGARSAVVTGRLALAPVLVALALAPVVEVVDLLPAPQAASARRHTAAASMNIRRIDGVSVPVRAQARDHPSRVRSG